MISYNLLFAGFDTENQICMSVYVSLRWTGDLTRVDTAYHPRRQLGRAPAPAALTRIKQHTGRHPTNPCCPSPLGVHTGLWEATVGGVKVSI